MVVLKRTTNKSDTIDVRSVQNALPKFVAFVKCLFVVHRQEEIVGMTTVMNTIVNL